MTTKTQKAIDSALEVKQGLGFRKHLGGSVIGRPCARQLWYTFRWARRSNFPARVLRLFQRGQDEEEKIVKWMRQAGVHVLDTDQETGKQFRIEDHDGHFGGSLDGKLFDTPDFPGVWVLGEFKTHNDKSFKQLRKDGLEKAKKEHLVQTQIYMHYEELPAALYFAVNKNDDDMEILTVEYDASVAEKYIDRAGKIIYAEGPPERISESPGWYICRWCDYKEICHHAALKEKNCRTCIHSKPIESSQWLCTKYLYNLTEADQRRGCVNHTEIPE